MHSTSFDRVQSIAPDFVFAQEPAAFAASLLFIQNLDVIDDVIRQVCRTARLSPDEGEDFASSAKLALMENDYAVLRKWQARSSLGAYLSVIIRRHLVAERRKRLMGRWRSSAKAARLGDTGMLVEKLLVRDGRSVDEALAIVRAQNPSFTADAVASMAEQFGSRLARPRLVAIEDPERLPAGDDHADTLLLSNEVRRLSRRASEAVRAAMASWADEDALLIRYRFGASMTIAEISRALRIPQRPLYRRIEGLLRILREALIAAGLDATTLRTVIGDASQEMDFGLEVGRI